MLIAVWGLFDCFWVWVLAPLIWKVFLLGCLHYLIIRTVIVCFNEIGIQNCYHIHQSNPPDFILGFYSVVLAHVDLAGVLPKSLSARLSEYTFFEFMMSNYFDFSSHILRSWTWFLQFLSLFSSYSSFLLRYSSSIKYLCWYLFFAFSLLMSKVLKVSLISAWGLSTTVYLFRYEGGKADYFWNLFFYFYSSSYCPCRSSKSWL